MGDITLKKIDENNFVEAFHLKFGEGQEKYVSNPIRSLAQAYVYYHQCTPFGIYADGTMVGYVMVIYDYDLEEYESDRGLYYPFNDYVYGSVAKNSLELATSIKEAKMMRKERKEFKDKFMSSCDGNSTKKTYEFIFKDKE